MTINFKIKKTWIITLCMLLGSLVSFGQDYSDEQIGFDVIREINFLKERGVSNAEDLSREIERSRKISRIQHIETERNTEEILQRMQSTRLLKTILSEDISQSEKDALKALYDSTDGTNWKNKTGWDFSTPVTSWNSRTKTGWYGVTVVNGQVTSLSLGINNLIGFIPSEIGQLKYVKFLSLRENKLSGPIPEEIGELINVEMLALDTNKLEGHIPQSLYNLKSLIYLYINSNLLRGEISPEIKKLTNLSYIYSSLNQLSGSIPVEIWQLSKLMYIDFRGNELIGSIPPEIGQLKKLHSLYLSYNKLTGIIPPEISLSKIQWMNLSYNQLSGNIPIEMEKIAFGYLYLNNNLFEGILPNLQGAYILDIRSNKFRFADMINRIRLYKGKTDYSPQVKTDTPKKNTSSTGKSVILTMFEDGRFLKDDTFQWFKNGSAIIGAIDRTYKITDLKATDAGIYSCKASHTNYPDMSPLVLEREPITLNIVNCTAITGTIKVLN